LWIASNMSKLKKEILVQSLPPRPICFEDITRASNNRQGWGNASVIVHAYIFYKSIRDFMDG
jgi:hypothetical protein